MNQNNPKLAVIIPIKKESNKTNSLNKDHDELIKQVESYMMKYRDLSNKLYMQIILLV